MGVSCPIINIFTVNPFDSRKAAMYPSEIGGDSGTKGFISISKIFTMPNLDAFVKSQVSDGFVKNSRSRLASPEE
jgi:hypothetical protein